MTEYQFHPIAAIFPLLEGAELQGIADSIKAKGLREPCWLYEGKILDGRNRYVACGLAGVEPTFREFMGTPQEAVDFVWDINYHRRHQTSGARAASLQLKLRMDEKFREAAEEVRKEADKRKQATIPKAGQKGFQASVPEIIREHNIEPQKPHARETKVVIAKAGGTNENYLRQTAKMDDDTLMEVAAGKKKLKDATAHVSHNSGENEWYTPAKYIEAALVVMGGIDCDPASSEIANKTVGATKFYTEKQDGLTKKWTGRVWMNPPYAQPLCGKFADTITKKFNAGEVTQACVLVNNATETKWFQTILKAASAVCFPAGRVKFLDPQGNPGAPLQGQAVLYLGKNAGGFTEAFAKIGVTLTK